VVLRVLAQGRADRHPKEPALIEADRDAASGAEVGFRTVG
jgi:hypothetical protein